VLHGFSRLETRKGPTMLNVVIVIGNLAKPLEVRNLPSGVSIANFDLVVPQIDGTPDTVPVALFEPTDEALQWAAGEPLLATGRVRRRFFRVGPNTQSRTEVVADRVVPMSQPDGARLALASVGPAIEGALEEFPPSGP
jgi:single-strand DNA-binding protein